MRLLLDTNTCIEILRGRNAALLAMYAGQPRADIAPNGMRACAAPETSSAQET